MPIVNELYEKEVEVLKLKLKIVQLELELLEQKKKAFNEKFNNGSGN